MSRYRISTSQASITIAIVAILSILGVRFVAAQTATSSDAAATSTEAGTSEASTTIPEASSTPVTTQETPAAPVEQAAQPEQQTTTPPDSAPANPGVTVAARDEIAGLQETYRRQTGKYLQILPGNLLPAYESGAVADKLGKTLPDNIRVDVYESAEGRGYQISYEENGIKHSFGYGPEAAERTYTIQAVVTATSTPQ